jgi:hypothetical protein
VNCQRTYIDVQLPGGRGRPWSRVPLRDGWQRVITNNCCPKGLVEDEQEMRQVKAAMEKQRNEYPNVAEMVRRQAFRHHAN